jgi:hypothetical protein
MHSGAATIPNRDNESRAIVFCEDNFLHNSVTTINMSFFNLPSFSLPSSEVVELGWRISSLNILLAKDETEWTSWTCVRCSFQIDQKHSAEVVTDSAIHHVLAERTGQRSLK